MGSIVTDCVLASNENDLSMTSFNCDRGSIEMRCCTDMMWSHVEYTQFNVKSDLAPLMLAKRVVAIKMTA